MLVLAQGKEENMVAWEKGLVVGHYNYESEYFFLPPERASKVTIVAVKAIIVVIVVIMIL